MSRIQPLLLSQGLIASFNLTVGSYSTGSNPVYSYYGYSSPSGWGSVSNYVNYISDEQPSMTINTIYDKVTSYITPGPAYYFGYTVSLSNLSSSLNGNLRIIYTYNITDSTSIATNAYSLTGGSYGSGVMQWTSDTAGNIGLTPFNSKTISIQYYRYY